MNPTTPGLCSILWQVARGDVHLPPVEQVRRAIAVCVERHGWRPVAVQVRPDAHGWPEEIDGARIVPTPRMSFPGLFLLVPPSGDVGAEAIPSAR